MSNQAINEDEQRANDADMVRRENARIGYQVAINMWSFEGEVNWSRSNVMLVANSIIIAVLSLALINQRPLPVLILYLSILGLVLCTTWFLLTKRGFNYLTYWVMSARELEELYLADPVKTLSRGESFAEGGSVTVEINGKPRNLRMSIWSRRFKLEWANYILIGIFTGVYILSLLQILL